MPLVVRNLLPTLMLPCSSSEVPVFTTTLLLVFATVMVGVPGPTSAEAEVKPA